MQVGGNIGTPLISLVESSKENTWSVVELSSFQLEAVPTFRPDIAVILNITPDHLDRYASFEAYAQAKLNIFENQVSSDFAVLNHDDPICRRQLRRSARKSSGSAGATKYSAAPMRLRGQIVFESGKASEPVMTCDEVSLKGRHNIENVAAAITAARLAGIPSSSIAREYSELQSRRTPSRAGR